MFNKKFISIIYLNLTLLLITIPCIYGMEDMAQTQGAFTMEAYEAMKKSHTTQELELMDAIFEKIIHMIVLLDSDYKPIEFGRNPEHRTPVTKVDFSKIQFLFIDKDYKQISYTFDEKDVIDQRGETSILRDLRIFYGSHEDPMIELKPINYLRRMQTYVKCSPSCYVIALKYIEKFINKVDEIVHKEGGSNIFNHISFYRIFLAAITIASKYCDDRWHANPFYAKMGGVSAEELWMLELQFIMIMKLDLHVSREEFDAVCTNLVSKQTSHGSI